MSNCTLCGTPKEEHYDGSQCPMGKDAWSSTQLFTRPAGETPTCADWRPEDDMDDPASMEGSYRSDFKVPEPVPTGECDHELPIGVMRCPVCRPVPTGGDDAQDYAREKLNQLVGYDSAWDNPSAPIAPAAVSDTEKCENCGHTRKEHTLAGRRLIDNCACCANPSLRVSSQTASAEPVTIDYCTQDEIAEGKERAASIDEHELRDVLAQTEAILIHFERTASAEGDGCTACNGTGKLRPFARAPHWVICYRCKGDGVLHV